MFENLVYRILGVLLEESGLRFETEEEAEHLAVEVAKAVREEITEALHY